MPTGTGRRRLRKLPLRRRGRRPRRRRKPGRSRRGRSEGESRGGPILFPLLMAVLYLKTHVLPVSRFPDSGRSKNVRSEKLVRRRQESKPSVYDERKKRRRSVSGRRWRPSASARKRRRDACSRRKS